MLVPFPSHVAPYHGLIPLTTEPEEISQASKSCLLQG